MRRFPLTGPGLVMILLAGCSTELSTAPYDEASRTEVDHLLAVSASQQAGPSAVPIRGTCNLTIQPGEFVSPGVIRQIDMGTCHISHLGRSTLVSDKFINLVAGTQTTEIVITAANGDMLYANGSGTNSMVAPGQVSFQVELTITNGTGRFNGASGVIVSQGMADLLNARSQTTMAGSIRY